MGIEKASGSVCSWFWIRSSSICWAIDLMKGCWKKSRSDISTLRDSLIMATHRLTRIESPPRSKKSSVILMLFRSNSSDHISATSNWVLVCGGMKLVEVVRFDSVGLGRALVFIFPVGESGILGSCMK